MANQRTAKAGGGKKAAGSKAASQVRRETRPPTPMEILRDQVARELGLMDKVAAEGWGGLTAAESGRVGARMSQHLRQRQETTKQPPG